MSDIEEDDDQIGDGNNDSEYYDDYLNEDPDVRSNVTFDEYENSRSMNDYGLCDDEMPD